MWLKKWQLHQGYQFRPSIYSKKIVSTFAGFSPEDAIIGVTVGCLEKLNRDQLQGVMAQNLVIF